MLHIEPWLYYYNFKGKNEYKQLNCHCSIGSIDVYICLNHWNDFFLHPIKHAVNKKPQVNNFT